MKARIEISQVGTGDVIVLDQEEIENECPGDPFIMPLPIERSVHFYARGFSRDSTKAQDTAN